MVTEINWGKDMTTEWEQSEVFNEILGGDKTAVGVVYMGREGMDREWIWIWNFVFRHIYA